MRRADARRGAQRVSLACILVFTSFLCPLSATTQPPPAPARAVAVVFEDHGKIIVEHGFGCGASDSSGKKQGSIKLSEKLIIPGYADKGTVILNGWFAEYLHGDENVRSLSALIHNIKVAGNALTWDAEGWLSDDNFDNGYRWCHYYTALAWNSKLIDAFPDVSNQNENSVLFSTLDFPQENTALVTLEPHIQNKAFVGKEAVAVLPRGMGFGFHNESSIVSFNHPVDHHLLQIAYNLDHTELFLAKDKAKLPTATCDQGGVSWVTHGIFKDDDDKRKFWFQEKVSALAGNDVGMVHPPFAIRPRDADSSGWLGTATWATSESVTIENVPFEYAVPVLTGWNLYYPTEDQKVFKIGVWLKGFKYQKRTEAATGTLTYDLSAVLADDDGFPEHMIKHRVTVLGLVKTAMLAADLVPNPSAQAPELCQRDSSGRLVFTVKNQGALDAAASVATVLFANGAYVDVATPAVGAGKTAILPPVTIPGTPTSCFTPNCAFRLMLDSQESVKESNESNNIADGRCQG